MSSTTATEPRILLEVKLQPLQGMRIQPTGFPDLGAAEFVDSEERSYLLVESAQSMANRLEAAIWDDAAEDLVEPLRGMPYVKATVKDLGETNSILEAHRLNSPYIVDTLESEIVSELQWNQKIRPDLKRLASYLLKRDPNSILHGVFFSNIKPGTLRLPRLLSAFIEARNVTQVASGGVKFDRLDAQGPAKDGKGHVPFHRVEYASESIAAFFNFDRHLLRSFGLSEAAEEFLEALAFYKIRRFLEHGLRLRSACDLETTEILVKRPTDFKLPSESELAEKLRGLIRDLSKKEFADPPVLLLEGK